MKTVTILFAHKNSKYLAEPCFDGLSAFEKALDWAHANESEKVFVFSFDENKGLVEKLLSGRGELVSCPDWKVENLVLEMKNAAEKTGSDSVIFAWADCPFLNRSITSEIMASHKEFLSEYTFADGYSYGFAPEMIDTGTLGILTGLFASTFKAASEQEVTRSALYDLLKTDINAFEVETVLADDDYRLLRYSFDTGKKENLLQCKALYESLTESEKKDLQNLDVETVSQKASKNKDILKTVPGYYNIQLSPVSNSKPDYVPSDAPLNNGENMDTEKAFCLIEQIADFSENAVVNLSFFGDPVNHHDLVKICEKILSYPGLSVFIETDYMDEELASQLKAVSDKASERSNGYEKIMISVNLDGASSETYAKLRGKSEGDFEKALSCVAKVSDFFPKSTYPQFTRLNENEHELETFYRYWNEKSNPSKGNLIIQKYNSFCKTLPDRKPADLSPVERNVCWHLRRDMNILSNGDVTFCHCLYKKVTGNVFENSLSEIWKGAEEEIVNQTENKYCKNCGDCDEYYTFNF
ncbi:MAG: spiro-SPASM protein [Treponema sp.]|nr:spiro-SPASM protein [Treponema sp.]